jgi:hypothetical protein
VAQGIPGITTLSGAEPPRSCAAIEAKKRRTTQVIALQDLESSATAKLDRQRRRGRIVGGVDGQRPSSRPVDDFDGEQPVVLRKPFERRFRRPFGRERRPVHVGWWAREDRDAVDGRLGAPAQRRVRPEFEHVDADVARCGRSEGRVERGARFTAATRSM